MKRRFIGGIPPYLEGSALSVKGIRDEFKMIAALQSAGKSKGA